MRRSFQLALLILLFAPILAGAQDLRKNQFIHGQATANEEIARGDGVNSRSGNAADQVTGGADRVAAVTGSGYRTESSAESSEQMQPILANPRNAFVGLSDSAINTDSIVGIFTSPLSLFYQVTGDTCRNCQASLMGAEGELHRRNSLTQQHMEFTENELSRLGGLRQLAWRQCIQDQMGPPRYHSYPDAIDRCQDKQPTTLPATDRGDVTGVTRTMQALYPFHPLNISYGARRTAANGAWEEAIDDVSLEKTYGGLPWADYPYAVTVWTSLLIRHYIHEWPGAGAQRFADLWKSLRELTGDEILQYGSATDTDPSTVEQRTTRIHPPKDKEGIVQELATEHFASFARRIARTCFAREGRSAEAASLGTDDYKDPVLYGKGGFGAATAIQFTRSNDDLADQFNAALNGIVVPQEVIDSFLYMGMQELNQSATTEPGKASICRKFYDSRCTDGFGYMGGECEWAGLEALDKGLAGGHTARTYAMKLLANQIAYGKFYTALKVAQDLTNQLAGGRYDTAIKEHALKIINEAAGLKGMTLEAAIRVIDQELLKVINNKKEDFANDSKGGGKKFKDPFQSGGEGLGSFGG